MIWSWTRARKVVSWSRVWRVCLLEAYWPIRAPKPRSALAVSRTRNAQSTSKVIKSTTCLFYCKSVTKKMTPSTQCMEQWKKWWRGKWRARRKIGCGNRRWSWRRGSCKSAAARWIRRAKLLLNRRIRPVRPGGTASTKRTETSSKKCFSWKMSKTSKIRKLCISAKWGMPVLRISETWKSSAASI